MTLRDLVVSVDFDDIDVNSLLKIDSAMDEIEDKFNIMGKDIKDNGQYFGRLGSKASGALNEIKTEANTAGDAVKDINDDTKIAGNALNQLGDDGKSAAKDISKSMNNAEGALKGLDNKADKSGDAMDELGDKTENAGTNFKKMGTIGAAAMGAISTAAGVAYGAISAVVMESETAFDRLEAKTGTTGEAFEGLKDVANNVFVGAFGDSIGQVTDDVAMLKSVFKDLNDEELQGLAEGAYTIGDLWGTEVKEVSTTVKNMTSNFKDLSEQDALDILTTGFQKTGDYSDDLLDTFKEYSPAFATMGHSAQDMANILISGSEAGAWNLDKVGDAMKEFNIRAKDGSDSTTEAFDLIGLKSQDMRKAIGEGGEKGERAFQATIAGLAGIKDEAQRTEAGVKLFGTSWEDLEKDVVLAMANSTNHLEGFEGATARAADTAYNNMGTRMTTVFRDLKTRIADAFTENGGEDLFNAIATAAENAIPKVESLVEKAIDFADTVMENWPTIKETIIGVSTAVGAFVLIMGTMSIISTVTTLLAAYRAGTLVATAAQMGLNIAMLANPMTWIVVGIAALIAVGVLLYRNWDTVKEKTMNLWDKLGEFQGVATMVLGPLGFIIRAAVTMADNWDNTKGVWENVWNGIKIAASNAVNDVITSINKMIGIINKIPGINIPIVPKVDWGAAKALSGTSSSTGSRAVGGPVMSHATGLERVPWDNYSANLHKDESVLTARQSNALRAAGILGKNGSKPTLEMGNNMSRTESNKSSVVNTFSPQINIEVKPGTNGNMDANSIAQAVKKEMEKFWMQMNLKEV